MSKKETWLFIIPIILGVAIFITLIVVGVKEEERVTAEYNNGICLKCGGHYELFDVVSSTSVWDSGSGENRHVWSSTSYRYIYKCDTCHRALESSHILD